MPYHRKHDRIPPQKSRSAVGPEPASPVPICHVVTLPQLDGSQRVMLGIFKHLDRERYRPHVVCRGEGPLTEELDRLDIPYLLVPELGRPIRPLRDFRAYRRLRSLFRTHRFQLVHTHQSKPGVLGRVAASHAGVPLVLHHVHGYSFHEFSPPHQRWMFSRLERWAGRHCDRVIFVNHQERRMSIRDGLLPAEKCLTIYNGVNLASHDPRRREPSRRSFRAEHGIPDSDLVILVIGRVDRQKQPLIVPKIAAQLETLCPSLPWRIVVVGTGPLQSELSGAVAHLGLGRRVSLVGWTDNPCRAYHAADVVLLPSLWEGLPLVLIEAQAAGLPTVASRIKGNREVVSEETGFLCDPQDAGAHARALSRLIERRVLRDRFGAAARRRAEKLFDAEANNRKIVAVYDELLRRAPARQPARRAA